MKKEMIRIVILRFLYILSVICWQPILGQSSKVFAIDINSGRVILDTISTFTHSIKRVDTLKFKFDAFSNYSHAYDSRHALYILECDTALILLNSNATLWKTIHKTGDVEGMVYDPVNDKVYCALWRTNSYYFTQLDLPTGTFTTIRSLSDNSVHSATIDYDSRWYYVISDTRGLLKINLSTGVKHDSVKYFTTNNCRCNAFDIETGKLATTCIQNGQYVMQLYNPSDKSIKTIDTIGKYGTGFFSYESAALDQNNGNWYMNLGKKIGIKNIRTNSGMDTFSVPYNRIRSLSLAEELCYRPFGDMVLAEQNPSCYNSLNGSINLKVAGGRKPYYYSLNSMVYDTNSVFKNLKAGNYTIFVKDKNGFCSLSVSSILNHPDSFHIESSIKHNNCYGLKEGSIALDVSGATPPYTFAFKGSSFQSDSVFKGLANGNYIITVKDVHGCLDSTQDIFITSPTTIQADSIVVKDIRCFGESNGKVKVYLSGGVSPYLISMDSMNFNAPGIIGDLSNGIYKIFIKDKNNCLIDESFSVAEPTRFNASMSIKNSQCYGYSNGTIKVDVTGGGNSDKYWFNLSGLPGVNSVKDTIRFLGPANYKMIIWNQNDCKDSLNFKITEPPVFRIPSLNDTTLCNGQKVRLNLHHPLAVSYLTKSNTGLQFVSDTLLLDKSGAYYSEAKNSNGCVSRDTFIVSKINMDVIHDFLVPTVAFLSDTIYAVNISRPVADKSEWLVDDNSGGKFSNEPFTIGVFFKDTGLYHITLQSRYKACGYRLVKPLRIMGDKDSSMLDPKYGYARPMIDRFEVYSNPNDGQHFNIRVELRDTASFSIYKIDAGSGYLTGEMHFANLKSQLFTAFTSSKSEVYYLKLVVGRESKVIKVVVVQ